MVMVVANKTITTIGKTQLQAVNEKVQARVSNVTVLLSAI